MFPSTLVGSLDLSHMLLFLSYACVERGSTISLCSLQLPFSLFVLPHPARRSTRCSPFNHSALPCLEQHELLFLKAQLVLRVRRGNNLLPSPFRSCIPLPHFVLSVLPVVTVSFSLSPWLPSPYSVAFVDAACATRAARTLHRALISTPSLRSLPSCFLLRSLHPSP